MYPLMLLTILAVTPDTTDRITPQDRALPVVVSAIDPTSRERFERGKLAFANGEFDIARREFAASVAMDREAGALPTDAAFGLAHALYAQSYNREAVITLERLAADAALHGDANVEAMARLDALWLKQEARQHLQARADATRLRELLADERVSPDTRRLIKARLHTP